MNANKQSSARLLAAVLAAAVVVCAFAAIAADVSADDETVAVGPDETYTTVSDAISAGATDIKLTGEVTDSELSISTAVTIDLNNKNWTIETSLTISGAVTIKNGTIDTGESTSVSITGGSDADSAATLDKVTFESSTVDQTSVTVFGGYVVLKNEKFKFLDDNENSKTQAGDVAVSMESGSVTFANSYGSPQLVLAGGATATVTLNTNGIPTAVSGSESSSIADATVNCNLTLAGGDESSVLEITGSFENNATVTVVGDVIATGEFVNNKTVTVGDGETSSTLSVSSDFYNYGTVNVAACVEEDEEKEVDGVDNLLDVTDGFVNYGSVNVHGGLSVDDVDLENGVTPFVNYGTVTVYTVDEGTSAALANVTGYGEILYSGLTEKDLVLGGEIVSSNTYTVKQRVTIVPDLDGGKIATIMSGTYIVIEGELIIPDGYTLVVEGTLVISGAGATLTNNGDLIIAGTQATYYEDTDDEQTYDYAFIIEDSATVVNNGGISLQLPNDFDEADYGAYSMIVTTGGSLTNNGVFQTYEQTLLYLDGTVRNHQEMYLGGVIYTEDDELSHEYTASGVIYNWDTVVFGDTEVVAYLTTELEIQMMADGAEVDIIAVADLTASDYGDITNAAYLGIVVGEAYATASGYSWDGKDTSDETYLGVYLPMATYDEEKEELTIVAICGLTVVATNDEDEDGIVTMVELKDGAEATGLGDDASLDDKTIPAVVVESGLAVVAEGDELTLEGGVVLYLYANMDTDGCEYSGSLYVAGTIYSTEDAIVLDYNSDSYTDDPFGRVITVADGGKITVLAVESDGDYDYYLDAYVNGTAYDFEYSTDVTLRVYTTIAVSLGDVADLEGGLIYILGEVETPATGAGLTVSNAVILYFYEDSVLTVPYGESMGFEEGSAVQGKSDTETDDNGKLMYGIIVKGEVFVEDVSTALKDAGSVNIVSDVVIDYDDGSRLYTNITDALANANPGETVKLSDNVVLEQDLTVPAGVTLDLNGYTLTVDDNTLTVDGTILADEAGSEIVLDDDSELVIDAGGCICGEQIDSYTAEALAIASSCAWYTSGGSGYVKPLEDALATDGIANADDGTVYFPGEGTVGDVTVDGVTLSVSNTGDTTAKLTASSVTLVGGTLEVEGSFFGTVSDADGAVDVSVTETTFEAASTGSGLTISGKADEADVSGSVYVSDEMKFETLVVDGTLTVDGTLEAVNVSVYGTITGDGIAYLTYTHVGQDVDVLGADATIDVAELVINDGDHTGYILASPGSTVADYGLATTDYYVEEVLWVTAYANAGDLDLAFENAGAELVPPITNGLFQYWVDEDGDFAGDADTGEYANVGDYKVVKAYAVYDIYSIIIYADTGVADVYIDGIIMLKSDNGVFYCENMVAGDYKITYALVAGYTGEAQLKAIYGTPESTVSGSIVSLSGTECLECVYQLVGVQSATGEGTSGDGGSGSGSSGDDGMTLTDWLLVILVILILIIAIIVAYRLLRN